MSGHEEGRGDFGMNSTKPTGSGVDNDRNKAEAAAEQGAPMTLAAVREELKGTKGKKYWRSIDELAGTAEFQEAVEREFPAAAQEWVDPVSRRGFMKLMGASMALAGLAGCAKQPDEPIYPYVKQPEDLVLGKPNYFATAHPFVSGAVPVLVKSDQYRPIKVDGNPEHAYNRGSSDVFTQGTLLDLYDPDRSQHVTYMGEPREWAEFAQGLRVKAGESKDGTGIYLLSTTITSPTLARQWKAVQAAYPKAKLVQYDPAVAGTSLAGGTSVQYALSDVDVIVSLDADFLSGAAFPGFHKLTREYALRRKKPETLNRLYTIESTPTTTGMKAEHRLGLRASEIPAFAAALAQAVGASGVSAPSYSWTAEQQKFLAALAKDLKAHAGKSAVIAGIYQDPSVASTALAINTALGNVGKTVTVSGEPVNPLPSDQIGDFKALVAEMNAGKVEWLVILNANPIYSSPSDTDFATAFNKVKVVAHLGNNLDETGQIAHWHIPAAHPFETWSDARSYDGTVSIVQPLIEPLYGAAIISGATLTKLGLEEDDIVELTVGDKKVKAPVIVAPGHPDNSVTVYLGYGREFAGRVGSGYGFSAYSIRPTWAPFYATGSIKKVEGKWGLAITKSHYQDHRSKMFGGEGNGNSSMETNEALGDRGIIRYATLDEYRANPGFANEGENHEKTNMGTSLFPNWTYKDNAWGMSIDMNSCVGCNACILSCYAENNIPVVGKQQVRVGRNMQWLRIDTYFEGDLAAPRAHFQPMTCQHCENAPCEQVCPVGATVHTPEGLNMMVYNRCVGTRYCSNNCPYKVRRFNFLLYSDYETESLKLLRNPDVSVRSRGVMEKCSYCVQRITAAKIEADKENRPVRDGEVVTACQQACPASAITFGNINDHGSRAAKLRADERTYQVLADLNTRPRTTYMAAVINPNSELAEAPVEHTPAKG